MKHILKLSAAGVLLLATMSVANAGNSYWSKPHKPVRVPEPAVLGLMGAGIVAAAIAARRRK